jgi:tetratricopeptide (TPR) repeat protein
MKPTADQLWSRSYKDGVRAYRLGDLSTAEGRFRAALGYAGAACSDGARRACVLYQLAMLAEQTGRSTDAEQLYRRALADEETALGQHHPYIAMILRAYGRLLDRGGRPDEAAALRARAETIWRGEVKGRANHLTVAA